MSAAPVRPIVILMVEDNPADVVFFKEAAEASQMAVDIRVVGNGTLAILFLKREVPFNHAPQPDVVVLDLNLPSKTGQEILEEMAADPAMKTIPVAILTTSASETNLCEIYPAGRCLYFTKTDELRRLQDIVRQIAAHAKTTGNTE